MPEEPGPIVPTMVIFSLTCIALIISIASGLRQKELAEQCRILPKK